MLYAGVVWESILSSAIHVRNGCISAALDCAGRVMQIMILHASPACACAGTRDPPLSYSIVLGPGVRHVVAERESFCYLEDVVNREAGVDRPIHVRIALVSGLR